MASSDQVSVQFMGKTYRVSKDSTLMGAVLETGWEPAGELGCLGGCCGACATLYRLPDETHVRTGLACRIPVQDGVSFSLVGRYPCPKPTDDLATIEDPKQALFDLFPEITGCRKCGSCVLACPQGIDVMRGIWCAVFGNFREAADLFHSCVQCGLCAYVCLASLRPLWVGTYVRRVQGALLENAPPEIGTRLDQINVGPYQPEWDSGRRGLERKSEGAEAQS